MCYLKISKEDYPVYGVQIVLTLLFYVLGQTQLFPNLVFENGVFFATNDSLGALESAAKILDLYKDQGVSVLINESSHIHIKIASILMYFMSPFVGAVALIFFPVNFLCLVLTVNAWKEIIKSCQIPPKWSSMILLFFPTLLIHYTQVLKEPLYIAVLLIWLNSWLKLLLKNESQVWKKNVVFILFLSVLLFLVRPRFWVMHQGFTAFFVAFILMLWVFRKSTLKNVFTVFLLFFAINSFTITKYSIKIYNSFMNDPQSQVVLFQDKSTDIPDEYKRLLFFQKLALLRKGFITSYDQASDMDETVRFESDSDVIKYMPRALQIGYFIPFPSMWFNQYGKTGSLGRLIGAYEMVVMSIIILLSIINLVRRIKIEPLFLYSIVSIAFCAFGLVITNAGALYRMRYAYWVLILACFFMTIPIKKREESV